jgi:hypothetical protein
VCVTFQPIDFCSVPTLQHIRQFVHTLALQWLPIFILHGTSAQQTFGLCQLSLILQNMTREDLTSPVAAAVTSQVKLCPYDEEELHIWFRLIEAQFAVAGIKSQKHNMPFPCQPAQASSSGHS